MEPDLEVSVVPNLYDLGPDHTGRLFLGAVKGDMVVLSWLYPRAAFWLLDRDGIKGHFGETQLKPPADDDEDERRPRPTRRSRSRRRSARRRDPRSAHLHARPARLQQARAVRRGGPADRRRVPRAARGEGPREGRQQPRDRATRPVAANGQTQTVPATLAAFTPEALLAPAGRRWYPVIDYSRCTNCLECLDFCLFGVYGVDSLERILVENQDQCKKGCPACSRVCPQQAIIFPEYKSAAIAGADTGAVGGLKIDLSKLFGGDVGDALAAAVQERDRELVNDGRDAVGMTVGIPKRQADKPQGPKDDLDKLVDDLDSLGLMTSIRVRDRLRLGLPHRPRCPPRRAGARRALGRRTFHLRPLHRDRGDGPAPRQPLRAPRAHRRRAEVARRAPERRRRLGRHDQELLEHLDHDALPRRVRADRGREGLPRDVEKVEDVPDGAGRAIARAAGRGDPPALRQGPHVLGADPDDCALAGLVPWKEVPRLPFEAGVPAAELVPLRAACRW